MLRYLVLIAVNVFIFAGITSCELKNQSFEISNVAALNNFALSGDSLVLEMDLSQGPFHAITLPSQNGKDADSVFQFQFQITNIKDKAQQYAYKIYYQNESYKHSELNDSLTYNRKSAENFYGSWIGDSLIGFKTSPLIEPFDSLLIKDFFTISGNPLNLAQYFDTNPLETLIIQQDVARMEEQIMESEEWYAAVVQKADENNQSIEKQLTMDATWHLQNSVQEGPRSNQRWQNNPRVGKYEFMIVVGPLEEINGLPNYILNPQLEVNGKGVRMNPFYYFKHGLDKSQHKDIDVVMLDEKLRTKAVLRPNYGLYYDALEFSNPETQNEELGSNEYEIYRTAHFKQFLNTEDRDSSLHNIKYIADVGGADYSLEKFNDNKANKDRNIPSYVERPNSPNINAFLDKENERIVVANPGNIAEPYRKENAGVEGRYGFTYGKFRARIQFPETLSKQGVWNGITCAFWLKFHSEKEWNLRDECQNGGYLESGYSNEDAHRIPRTTYSEIDIEIVKASSNWPLSSYENPDTVELYNHNQDGNLLVTCTNWDWACPEPSKFSVGAKEFKTEKRSYTTHRWSHWYKALTIKSKRPYSETVGEIYLYEIDWRPTEIIWKIGEDPSNMTEVGYMDSSITKIPNNQMSPVMSQEFHYGHWWPTTAYPQGDIPYPASPIEGALYEIIIE